MRPGHARWRAAKWRSSAQLRLRDIGAGAFAHIQPRLGRTNLLVQELEVALGQDGDLAIANHVHISADRAEQRVHLVVAQVLGACKHLRFGAGDIVSCLKAVEQRLVDLNAKACRRLPRSDRRSVTDVADTQNSGPITGLGNRNALIGHPHAGASRIQRRIELVGLGHCARNRFGKTRHRRERGGRK